MSKFVHDSLIIRQSKPADESQLKELLYQTVHQVNSRDYDSAQLEAWAPAAMLSGQWPPRAGERQTWVAELDGRIAGFAELQPDGHIDCFYCHHQYQRRGVGHCLFKTLLDHARSAGIRRLSVDASITARPFFQAVGFSAGRARLVKIRGQSLMNFRMSRLIDE